MKSYQKKILCLVVCISVLFSSSPIQSQATDTEKSVISEEEQLMAGTAIENFDADAPTAGAVAVLTAELEGVYRNGINMDQENTSAQKELTEDFDLSMEEISESQDVSDLYETETLEEVSDNEAGIALYSVEEEDTLDGEADDDASTVSIEKISFDGLKATTTKKDGASDYDSIMVSGHISFTTNEVEDKNQVKDALIDLLNNTKYTIQGLEKTFASDRIVSTVNEWVNKSDYSFQININETIPYNQQSKITVSCGSQKKDITVTKDPLKKELETPGTPSSITGKVGESLSIKVENATSDIYADLYDGDQRIQDTASKGVQISVDNGQKKVNLTFIHAYASKNYTLKIYTKKDGDKVDQSKSISIVEINKGQFGVELKNASSWVKNKDFEILIVPTRSSYWDIITGVQYDVEIKMQDKADTTKTVSVYSAKASYNASRNGYVISIPKSNYSKLTSGKEYNIVASVKNSDWNIQPVVANTSVRLVDLSYTLVTDQNGQITYPYTDGSGNKWTKDNVVFKMDDNCDGYVAYKVPDRNEWVKTGNREFNIRADWSGKSIVYTYYKNENEVGNSGVENSFKVYIDQEKPGVDGNINVQLYNYNNNVQGLVENALANELSVQGKKQVYLVLSSLKSDSTGVSKVTMHYGDNKSLDLTKVNVSGLSWNQYVFMLNKDALYKDVSFSFTDGVGNESELISFGKSIAVTINSLDCMLSAKTAGSMDYYGSYSNDAVTYTLTLRNMEDGSAVSGDATYTVAYRYKPSKSGEKEETGKQVTFAKNDKGNLVATITIGAEDSCYYVGNVSFEIYKKITSTDANGEAVSTSVQILKNLSSITNKLVNIQKVKLPENYTCKLTYDPDPETGWYNKELIESHQGKMAELVLPNPKDMSRDSETKKLIPGYNLVYVIYKQVDDKKGWNIYKAYEIGYKDGTAFKRNLNTGRSDDYVSNYKITSPLVESFDEDGTYLYVAYYAHADASYKPVQYSEVVSYSQNHYVTFCSSDKPVRISMKEPENLQMRWGDVSLLSNPDNGNDIIFSKDNMNIEGFCDGGNRYFFKVVADASNMGDKKNFPAFGDYSENNKYTIESCKKGYVVMFVRNEANNKSYVVGKKVIVDNVEPKGEVSASSNPNKNGYYNTALNLDVNVTDEPTDAYSGIKEISYTVYVDEAPVETDVLVDLSSASKDKDGLIPSHKFQIKLDPEKYEGTDYKVVVKLVDNAGNPAEVVSQVYKLDAKAPEIAITYDPIVAQNDATYINSNVTATITVTEKNFDPNGFKLVVTKDGVKYPVTVPANSWVMDKAKETSIAKVTLSEDGKFVVTAECIDLADNKAEYDKVDTFIIDMTNPKVSVSYNNDDARNESYYNKERTATITVIEENFDEKLFILNMDGSSQTTVGKWSTVGSTHTMTIQFTRDGSYEWSLKGSDLAGNEAEEYKESLFYIDTVSPSIEISGVEDKSANAGDVNPIVVLGDENFDAEGASITLKNSKGVTVKLSETKVATANGYSYALTNVNALEDEIYTLMVSVKDLAGNESTQEIRFSLNRNGSAYDLSQIDALMEKVYVRYDDMEDVNIYEMNVDQIESFTIFMSRNGEMMMNVRNGNRPTNIEQNTVYYMSKESGSDEKGYEYQYTIFKENFQEEGMYNVTLYSKDEAGNEVNSTLTDKGAEIIFVVDNTKPEVIVSGIPEKEGEYFKTDHNQVNVVVNDNFMLDEASIVVLNENEEPIIEYNYLDEVNEAGDIFSFTLDSEGEYVAIAYKASDKAGNVVSVLIDENTPFEETISNNVVLPKNDASFNWWWIMVIVLIVLAGGSFGYLKKKNGSKKQGTE